MVDYRGDIGELVGEWIVESIWFNICKLREVSLDIHSIWVEALGL
jgi:hypothetical protein